MKKNLHILICLEQTALLDSTKHEQSFLESHLHLKFFGIVKEAEEYLNFIYHEVVPLSLMICSASFSETDGVDLIVRLHEHSRTTDAQKILICKQLDSDKILRAANHGGLNYCQLVPWQNGVFVKTVIKILSEYVARFVDNTLPYAFLLNENTILHHIRNQNPTI